MGGSTGTVGWPRGGLSRRDLPDRVIIWDHLLEGPTIEYLTQISQRCPLPVTWVVQDQIVIEDA